MFKPSFPDANSSHPALRTLVGVLLTVALSSVAGMTDAIGFSQTGEFVSFMSGNTTRMAIAFGDGDWSRAERLGMVLFLFVVGNTLGAIIARFGHARNMHGTAVILYISVLLALAAGLPAIPGLPEVLGLESLPGMTISPTMNMTLIGLVLTILAMGAMNSAVEEVAGVGVGLTYVTGALSKFGRGLGRLLMGERRFDWTLQLAPWTGIAIGALIGELCNNRFGRQAIWLPCLMSVVLTICSVLVPRDWQKTFI